ncbi:MAG: site-specific integrase [Ruminococcus sp.]|nr:site-specific integrase [Ruminococcus sp.]
MATTGSLSVKYGTYYAIINLKDENGKRKQKWIPTGYTVKGNKKKAERFLREKIAEWESKNVEYYTNMKFSEYLEKWLLEIKNQVKPNTYRSYKGNMENHIIPYFKAKGIELQELKPRDLTGYYQYKVNSSELSTTTIKHHHQNISKALTDAVEKGFISVNPSSSAKTPKQERFETTFLNTSQINKLLDFVKGSTIELPVELCCIYGFRRSEVLGLKWSAIDFENGTIHIAETLQQSTKKINETYNIDGGNNYTSTTKNVSSNRTLPLTRKARELLLSQFESQKEYKELFGSDYIDSDYVCTYANGKVITPNYLTKNFHKAILKTDLPSIRLHDLRHSVASNLLNSGFTVVQVAEWLGHSSSTTTLSFYAHIDKTSKMAIANALDNV